MADHETNAADEGEPNDQQTNGVEATGSLGVDRRDFMRIAGSGIVASGLGTAAFSGSAAAVTTSSIRPSDGFADVAPWLESSDVDVHRVQEATRSAVESAFNASGARVVVFETSGTIDLGGETLTLSEDQCWVAGQTAPSPGITFINGMVQVDANDCVVQHVRSRIGPGPDGNIQGNDAMNTQDDTSNNVIDHVSASWGTDECLSVGYDTTDTTVTNCLIYEGLYDPYGDGSDHNYCSLIGDGASNVTLAGNVWAKARNRIPRLKSDTSTVVANNFAYFFDEASNTDGSAETAWVGNKYAGLLTTGEPIVEGSGTVYAEDNVTEPTLDSDVSFVGPDTTGSRPLWPSGFSAMAASDVESHNLANAGARPADRTENDARIVEEIRSRAGEEYLDSEYDYWIPHPDAVGGYPELPENTHSLSVPSSGLRDWLAEWAAVVEGDGGDPGDGGGSDDTTAPSTPSNLSVGGTSASSVDLSWDAATDSGGTGLSHYVVSVGDQSTQVSAGTTSATVDGLAAGTEYQATVTAVDGAGNQSGVATASATTDTEEDPGSGSGERGSHFGPEDGFATADWFDDSVEVITISDLSYEPIQAAFETSGPRLVVFEESGVLNLDNQTLEITEPNCWVAGQTAPSPGVTFTNGFVQVDADDVVLEHVRVFRGDQSGGEGTDPMNSADGTSNVIFNHCSAFWGRDENLSVGYDSTDTTLANCLVAEGLEDPEENSNGTLVGDGAQNVAIMGTVYAKNNDRNPRLKSDTSTVVVNGLNFYNDKSIWIDASAEASVVGNAYLRRFSFRDPVVFGDGSVHMEDNYVADPPLDGRPFSDVGTELDSAPLWPSGLEALPSSQTEAHDLANAGARPADRIGQEAKVVQQIRDRWGSLDVDPNEGNACCSDIPDSVSEAGGYPDHGGTTRALDVPDSGLRAWIDQMAAEVEPDEYDGGQGDTEAPTQPGNLAVTDVGVSSVSLDWDASSDSGGSDLWRYNVLVDGQQQTSVAPETTATTVTGLESGVDYEIGVVAVDGAGNESGVATVTATTEDADEDRTGGAGPITVEGGGADIWNDADAFHYYYASAGTEFDVAVNVENVEDTDDYAKAGLMVRESMDAGAQNVMIRRTPSETSVQWRPSSGGSSTSLTSDEGESESEIDGGTTSASWQRLVRSGDQIRAYVSDDGAAWTLAADLTLSFSDSVSVGLAVTSHSTGTLCAGEFDSLTGLSPDQNRDVGDVDVAGSVTDESDGDGSEEDTDSPSTPPNLSVTGTTESSVDVSWDGASDSGGSGLDSYLVTVDGDDDGTVAAGTTSATVDGLSAGTSYEIGVTAVDGAGNHSGTATTTATTSGGDDGSGDDGTETPSDGLIAELDPSATSASVGEGVTFQVVDTSGDGRWIDSLSWTFGDGTSATGWWNSHSYDSAGEYVVSLVATDNEGAETTDEVTITVS